VLFESIELRFISPFNYSFAESASVCLTLSETLINVNGRPEEQSFACITPTDQMRRARDLRVFTSLLF
jgi:hypothetical protein